VLLEGSVKVAQQDPIEHESLLVQITGVGGVGGNKQIPYKSYEVDSPEELT